jgi:ribonuclease R
VYSFIFTLDKDGKVINERFNRGVINTNYRLTYNEVQKVIEGGELDDNELKKAILDLNRYAIKLRKKRSIKNSLQFSGSEVRFKFDDSGYPTDVYFLEQKEANWLIEEFMVLTNRRVCEYITKKDVPMIHRTHDSPDLLKLESLKTFVESIGYILDINDKDNIKKNLNELIFQAKDTPEENIINNLVIRCMSKANYQTINVGHYGLGVEYYMHTTSPIRRYPDLIFHRIISSVLKYNGYLK